MGLWLLPFLLAKYYLGGEDKKHKACKRQMRAKKCDYAKLILLLVSTVILNHEPKKMKYLTTSNPRKFAQSPTIFSATSFGKLSVVTAGRQKTHRIIQIISKLLRLFAKPPKSSKIERKVFRGVLVLVNLLLLRFDFEKLRYRALTLKDTLLVM